MVKRENESFLLATDMSSIKSYKMQGDSSLWGESTFLRLNAQVYPEEEPRHGGM